jgi:hypothetical protein
MGKLSYALPVVAILRLLGSAGAAEESLGKIQVCINDVARTMCGGSRMDHMRVEDVLLRADYLSANQLAFKAVAMTILGAFISEDGYGSERNPLGKTMFGSQLTAADSSTASRPSRAAAAGEVWVPAHRINTFINHSTVIWNKCPELRSATTKAAACKAAANLAAEPPI